MQEDWAWMRCLRVVCWRSDAVYYRGWKHSKSSHPVHTMCEWFWASGMMLKGESWACTVAAAFSHLSTVQSTTGAWVLVGSRTAFAGSSEIVGEGSLWAQRLGLACFVFLVFQACSFLPTAVLIQHFSYAVLDETYAYPFSPVCESIGHAMVE